MTPHLKCSRLLSDQRFSNKQSRHLQSEWWKKNIFPFIFTTLLNLTFKTSRTNWSCVGFNKTAIQSFHYRVSTDESENWHLRANIMQISSIGAEKSEISFLGCSTYLSASEFVLYWFHCDGVFGWKFNVLIKKSRRKALKGFKNSAFSLLLLNLQ